MNKKSLILLPALMMILASCSNNSTSESTTSTGSETPSTTTSSGNTSTTEPTTKSSLQIAYEACEALGNKKESTESYEFDGVIVATNGNSFFVQKDDYGLYVYASKAYDGVAIGKSVVVNAKLKKYNGTLETGTINSVTVGEDSTLPEAVKVSSLAELAALKQNILVDYNAAIPSNASTWSASDSPLVTVKIGNDSVIAKFDKAGYTTEKGAIYNSAKGHTLKVTNAITTAYDTKGASTVNQSLVVGSSEIELVKVPATAVTISADKTTVDVGDTVTLSSVVTPENTTDSVSYVVTEGESNCTLNGNTIVATAAGTVKVKAVAGEVSSDELAITINVAADPIVSISAVGPTNKTAGDTLVASEVTVTATKQSSATEGITSGFTIQGGESYTFTDEDAAAGSKVVTIAYMEFSTTITVTVAAKDRTIETAYKAAANLDKGKSTTESYEFDGVVTAMIGNAFFVQDNGYGMYVYANTKYDGLEVGKNVRVNATLQNYSGCLETKSISSVTVLGDGTLPAAINVSTKTELADLNQNILINVVATMPASLNTWSASKSANNKVTLQDGNTTTASFQKASFTSDLGTAYSALASKSTKFTNAVTTAYDYSSGATTTNQFFVIEFKENIVPATSVTCVASTNTVEVGASITLSSVVTPTDSTDTVSYEIQSGSEHATLSGNTLIGASEGTVEVVAKAGSQTSSPVSITVTASSDPIISISVTGPSSSKLSGETLTREEITVTANKQSGATQIITSYTTSETLPYTFTDADASTGSKVINFAYLEKTAQLTINVVAPVYTLTCNKVSGGNNAYASNGDATVDNITWNASGNITLDSGWRFGGKDLSSATDRALYSKTAITSEVNYIALSIGTISTSTASLSVSVHSTAEGAKTGTDAVATFTKALTANSTVEINKVDTVSWANCYYRIVFTVTTGSSNSFVQLKSVTFANK